MRITILILTISLQISAQRNCSLAYNEIYSLQRKSHSVIEDKDKPLSQRIRESKRLARRAIDVAYESLNNKECNKYSAIFDRVIELHIQMGKPNRAKRIACNRLNKLTPEWKGLSGRINPKFLSVLARISNYRRSESFYRRVKKYKGIPSVCGTVTYDEKVESLYWTAKELLDHYGQIYCLKFLQSSTLIINEDQNTAKEHWIKIYDLLINSLAVEQSYNKLRKEYEVAEIKKKELDNWEKMIWESEFKRSLYYIEVGGMQFYFKTEPCPNEQNKWKRCQPSNPSELKAKTELYNQILEYTS